MCLDKVKMRFSVKNKHDEVQGFKVCKLIKGRIHAASYTVAGKEASTYGEPVESSVYPLRQWLKSTKGTIGHVFQEYERGFHVLRTAAGAKQYRDYWYGLNSSLWVVVPVRVRKIVAEGTQNDALVIVAKEIRFEHGCIKRALR